MLLKFSAARWRPLALVLRYPGKLSQLRRVQIVSVRAISSHCIVCQGKQMCLQTVLSVPWPLGPNFLLLEQVQLRMHAHCSRQAPCELLHGQAEQL